MKRIAIIAALCLLPACAKQPAQFPPTCSGTIPIVAAGGVEVAPLPKPAKKVYKKKWTRKRSTVKKAAPVKKATAQVTRQPINPPIPLPLEPVPPLVPPPLQ